MGIHVTMSNSSFELHDADEWYAGEILEIEASEGNFGPQLKWIIELDDDDDGRETWAYCSQKLSPRSKLFSWLKGLEIVLEPGASFDVSELEGTAVEVMFERTMGVGDDGTPIEREKVTKIRKKKGRARKARKAADTPDYGPDEEPF